jgi:hypothetical protein
MNAYQKAFYSMFGDHPWLVPTTTNPETESGTSQASQILAYMKAGNRITGLQALDLFGCFRLPARIADIKRAGHTVIKDTIVVNGKRVAQYRMEA